MRPLLQIHKYPSTQSDTSHSLERLRGNSEERYVLTQAFFLISQIEKPSIAMVTARQVRNHESESQPQMGRNGFKVRDGDLLSDPFQNEQRQTQTRIGHLAYGMSYCPA